MFKFLFGQNPITTFIGCVIGAIQGSQDQSLEGIAQGILFALLGRLTNEIKKP